MERVEAEVAADLGVEVLRRRAVRAQQAHARGERGVVRRDEPGVAERAEVLRREEAERGERAQPADGTERGARADRLRGVLDEAQPVRGGERLQRRHRARLTEEVHREDQLRLRGDRPLDLRDVEVERRRVDVDEDGHGAEARDAACRREEAERRGDDLVAGPEIERHQRDEERVGAARDADRVLDAEVRGDGALEGLDLRAEDEVPVRRDALEGGAKLRHQRLILRGEVEERDGRGVGHGLGVQVLPEIA